MSEAADAVREEDHDGSRDLELLRQEALFLASSSFPLQTVPTELLALFYAQFAKALQLRVAGGQRPTAHEQALLDAVKRHLEQVGR